MRVLEQTALTSRVECVVEVSVCTCRGVDSVRARVCVCDVFKGDNDVVFVCMDNTINIIKIKQ